MFNPQESNYQSVLGLSCIENHVLAILKANDFPVEKLYSNCFVSLKELRDRFFVRKVDFAHFDGVGRVQDDLKNEGIITLKLHVKEIKKLLEESEFSNSANLVLLKSEYANNEFMVRGWHEKHYALLFTQDKKLFLQNDIPFCRKEISLNEIEEFYGGEYFSFELHKDKYQDVLQHLKKSVPETEISQWLDEPIKASDVIAFRDLVGVYRILIRRQRAFCQSLMNIKFFDKYVKAIDVIYLRIEYINLKKVVNEKELDKLWSELKEIESDMNNELEKERVTNEKK